MSYLTFHLIWGGGFPTALQGKVTEWCHGIISTLEKLAIFAGTVKTKNIYLINKYGFHEQYVALEVNNTYTAFIFIEMNTSHLKQTLTVYIYIYLVISELNVIHRPFNPVCHFNILNAFLEMKDNLNKYDN